jgi:hypothetical protein
MVALDAGIQLGHAGRAARAAQLPVLVDRDAAGVVAPVFEPLQSLDQDRDDVALADRADDAAHGDLLESSWRDARRKVVERAFHMQINLMDNFTIEMKRRNIPFSDSE